MKTWKEGREEPESNGDERLAPACYALVRRHFVHIHLVLHQPLFVKPTSQTPILMIPSPLLDNKVEVPRMPHFAVRKVLQSKPFMVRRRRRRGWAGNLERFDAHPTMSMYRRARKTAHIVKIKVEPQMRPRLDHTVREEVEHQDDDGDEQQEVRPRLPVLDVEQRERASESVRVPSSTRGF